MMLSEKKLRLVLAFALGFIVAINIKFITDIETIDDNTTNKNNPIRSSLDAYNNDNDNGNSNNSNNGNSSPLDGIRILVAITAFDFSQIPHLEEVIDSYQDLCVTSVSKIDIVIYTTHAYPVTLIDLWNNRINPSCKRGRRRQQRKQQHDAAAADTATDVDVDVDVDSDIESSSIFSMTIIVKPYSMRLFLVDCHRYLFYDKIDDYDLFIYTEDDMIVRPKLIASYIDETDRVIDIVGLNKSQDFNVGIVRYEYNFPSNVVIDDNTRHSTQNVTRVYWEHMDKPIFPKSKKTKGGSSGY